MSRRSDSAGGWQLACPDCGQDLGSLHDFPLKRPATNDAALNRLATNDPATNDPVLNDPVLTEPALNRPDLGGRELNDAAPDLGCPACGRRLSWRGSILDALPASKREVIERFLYEYGAVRRAEGRGSDDPAWYRDLPFVPDSDPLARQWAIRSQSWKCFENELLRQSTAGRGIDLGAGVGWLSARLAATGWDMLAIDLSDDDRDGLGASRHFAQLRPGPTRADEQPPFDYLLAHFDHLPLAAGQADLVVFNASFHYSSDFSATLAEALRVLARGGLIVILDSPTYLRRESGEMMVRERRADFARRFGFASDAQNSREFLLKGELDSLGGQLGIQWRRIRPRYGIAWRARPIRYRLAGKGREPADFALWVGRRKGEGERGGGRG